MVCHAVEKELLEHPNRRLLGSALLGRDDAAQPVACLPSDAGHPQELVVDGDTAEGFTVIHTPGHAGHIALLPGND